MFISIIITRWTDSAWAEIEETNRAISKCFSNEYSYTVLKKQN